MRAAKHAPRDPFRVLERRHGLAVIVERRAGVFAESLFWKCLEFWPGRAVVY